jgi:hypothetical protein
MANYEVGQWRWKGLSDKHRVERLSGSKNLTVNTLQLMSVYWMIHDLWALLQHVISYVFVIKKIQNRSHVYMKLFSHKDLGNLPLQYCPLAMNHPVYSISTNFRCQYPHVYAVQLHHVHPTGSMWLASFLFWALNLSLDTCEHCIPLLQGGSNMTGTDFFLNHNCQTL